MINVTDAWHRFIKNVELRRFAVLLLIVFVLWMMRSMMNMILFTFILTSTAEQSELGSLCSAVVTAFFDQITGDPDLPGAADAPVLRRD